MVKFQIIIEKKGVQKIIKPFLSKTVSTLALIFSVIALSTLIGLGIHLVLAGTGPTQPPPGGNVPSPINVTTVAQTKEGKLSQKDLTWQLYPVGNIEAIGLKATGGIGAPSITSYDLLLTQNDLQVDGNIYAPNQGRENIIACLSSVDGDCQYSTPRTSVIECPDGWFLHKLQVVWEGRAVSMPWQDPSYSMTKSQGWCAAPFKKTQGVIYGGGGGGNPDQQDPNSPITWPRPAI
jgi:hypothetical protein